MRIQYPVWIRISPVIDCILFGGNLIRIRDEEKLFLNKFLFALLNFLGVVSLKILREGGLQPKKTERYRKFQIWDWFFSVFSGFFGFSILANFDWFNGFLFSGSSWL